MVLKIFDGQAPKVVKRCGSCFFNSLLIARILVIHNLLTDISPMMKYKTFQIQFWSVLSLGRSYNMANHEVSSNYLLHLNSRNLYDYLLISRHKSGDIFGNYHLMMFETDISVYMEQPWSYST